MQKKDNKGRVIANTTEDFIKQANTIYNHKYKYDLVHYVKNSIKVKIICFIHGIFEQTPQGHLKGGCKKCATTNQFNKKINKEKGLFIEFCKNKFNDKYNYNNIDYKNSVTNIKLYCKFHGNFLVLPSNHKRSPLGCPKCSNEEGHKKLNYQDTIHRKSQWIERAKNKQARFYIIKCFNDTEIFFKLGITFLSLKRRYTGNRMPYKYNLIKEVISTDLNYIWDLEKRFKSKMKSRHYTPNIKFGGHKYECFK